MTCPLGSWNPNCCAVVPSLPEFLALTPMNHIPSAVAPIPWIRATSTRGPLRHQEMICHSSATPDITNARPEMQRLRITGGVQMGVCVTPHQVSRVVDGNQVVPCARADSMGTCASLGSAR